MVHGHVRSKGLCHNLLDKARAAALTLRWFHSRPPCFAPLDDERAAILFPLEDESHGDATTRLAERPILRRVCCKFMDGQRQDLGGPRSHRNRRALNSHVRSVRGLVLGQLHEKSSLRPVLCRAPNRRVLWVAAREANRLVSDSLKSTRSPRSRRSLRPPATGTRSVLTSGLRARRLFPPVMPPLPDAIADDGGEAADQGDDQNRPESAAQPVFADCRPDRGREKRAEPGQPGRRLRHLP